MGSVGHAAPSRETPGPGRRAAGPGAPTPRPMADGVAPEPSKKPQPESRRQRRQLLVPAGPDRGRKAGLCCRCWSRPHGRPLHRAPRRPGPEPTAPGPPGAPRRARPSGRPLAGPRRSRPAGGHALHRHGGATACRGPCRATPLSSRAHFGLVLTGTPAAHEADGARRCSLCVSEQTATPAPAGHGGAPLTNPGTPAHRRGGPAPPRAPARLTHGAQTVRGSSPAPQDEGLWDT